MHLIVLVVALLLERTLGQLARLRRISVFARYIGWIEHTRAGRSWLARPAGVLVILPPLLVVGIVQWQLAAAGWLAARLGFALVILLVSFGPRDLWEDVYALAHARSEAAHEVVEARARALARRASGHAPDDTRADTLLGAVLVQGHERVLAVVLWFIVAGPVGALFYRLVRELPVIAARSPASRATARTAEYIHGAAAFVPARVVALLYGLVGRTFAAARAWHTAGGAALHLRGSASWRLLAVIGRAALGYPPGAPAATDEADLNERLLAALSLISRTLLVLLALYAAATLLGLAR